MKKILLASHGYLAQGLENSLRIFIGDSANITTACAYTDEANEYVKIIDKFIYENDDDGQTAIFTDIYGGSVNTQVIETLARFNKNIPLIANMNLPLVLSVAISPENITQNIVDEFANESIGKLIKMDINNKTEDEEDDFFG